MALRLSIHQRDPERVGEVLVVLIHGLAEPERTWVCEQTTWKDLLLSDPKLSGVDVGVVQYDTALIGNRILAKFGVSRLFGKTVGQGNFTRIETLSRELKREFDQEQTSAYRSIVLVGHSMGGLVGIRYILEEMQREVPLRVGGYISLATPFNGSLIAVGQHVLGRVIPHQQIAQLVPNSDFQTETRNLWKKLKGQNKLEHIRFTFCYGTQDTIVYENDATPYVVDDGWSDVVPLPGDHSGVIEVQDHASASYREVQKLVRQVMQTPPDDPNGGGRATGVDGSRGTEGSSATSVRGEVDSSEETGSTPISAMGEGGSSRTRGLIANSAMNVDGSTAILNNVDERSIRTEGSSGTSASGIADLPPIDGHSAVVALQTTRRALTEHLQRHRAKFERDITRFPVDAQGELSQAMMDVFAKLTSMDDHELRAFLAKYRYPFTAMHETEQGMRELWELLTLIHYAYPDWRFQPTDICNLLLEPGRWSHLIYSAEEQPMLEIVLEMAEELKNGPYASLLRGGQPLLPHRLVLENARSTPRENVCEHCGQPYPFRNILSSFSEAEYTGFFEEVETNGYSELEGVKVSCGDCIRLSRDGAQNAEEVRQKIRRVV